MAYCGPRALPHSQFLSWDPDDQDKALAWLLEDMSRCPGCGTHPDDWIGEEKYPLEPPPYSVGSQRCLGCVAAERERKKFPENATGYQTHFKPYAEDELNE